MTPIMKRNDARIIGCGILLPAKSATVGVLPGETVSEKTALPVAVWLAEGDLLYKIEIPIQQNAL